MKIHIDNIEIEAENGQTLLEAASKAGISIPTLCNREGIEPYSTCMVCIVKDKKRNSFVPSCSSLVQDDMDIDASGEEVLRLRKKAVELLLLEHRAECEAQCRIVCPEGYNIPLMNRLLVAGKAGEAKKLIMDETNGDNLRCITCKAFCENACRRKKIDLPVSIRNIRIFLYNLPGDADNETVKKYYKPEDVRKRFSSRTGLISEAEQNEWTRECSPGLKRFREIIDLETAAAESGSCMRCDCRAADSCKLRDIAEEFDLKDPKGKFVNSPITKKISSTTGLVFENAKCIKCGLCVRISDSEKEGSLLCFVNRGFVSLISEPVFGDFEDITAALAEKYIEICPTGALTRFDKISDE